MNINSANSFFRFFGSDASLSASTIKPALGSSAQLKPEITESDRVSLSQQLEAPEAKGRAFYGNQTTLLVDSDEDADQIASILNRITEDQQKSLIDSNVLLDDEFVKLVGELDDEELSELTDTLDGLSTLPRLSAPFLQENNYYNFLNPAEDFLNILISSDTQTRSQLLEQSSLYAGKVAKPGENYTYGSAGAMYSTASANDLHNFAFILNQMEDIDPFLGKLMAFDEAEQSELLHVFSMDIELGERLLDNLEDKDKDLQRELLNFLGGVAESSSFLSSSSLWPTSEKNIQNSGTVLTKDNNARDITRGMIEGMFSLLEDYQFSDEQLLDMGKALNSMDRSNQRAYLDITTTGLEHLLKDEDSKPLDISEHVDVLDAIETLRSDANVRDLVFKSRVGEKRDDEHEGTHQRIIFYTHKTLQNSRQDMKSTIELLASHALLNNTSGSEDDDNSTIDFAKNLNQMPAGDRDDIVRQLYQMIGGER